MDLKAAVQEAFSSSSSTVEVKIPDGNEDLHSVVSRWSDADINLPALVIVPSTEEDIITAVHFAKSHKLKLIPANGKHGSFVPVTDKTLYLDLKKFNTVSFDNSKVAVTVGGGANMGQVLRTLDDHGYYIPCVNSNTVGVVGAFLGTGSGPFNGMHGLIMDNVQLIRLITSSGETVDLDASSTGDKAALFNTCCGAGHGLGVITSITLRAYPISSLEMDDNKIWIRRVIFPPSEITSVSDLYVSFLPPSPKLVPTLLFARAPPTAPKPGAPMIMLTISYYGPSTSAENALTTILSSSSSTHNLISKAISTTTTTSTPIAQLNDPLEPLNRHGDYKETFASLTKTLTPSSITNTFHEWLDLSSTSVPDAKPSYIIFTSWDTRTMLSYPQRFFPWRDRGVFCLATLWYTKPDSRSKVTQSGNNMMSAVRASDDGEGEGEKKHHRAATLPNDLRKGIDLSELYTAEMMEEIKRVKAIWDPEGVFWSPVVDGI